MLETIIGIVIFIGMCAVVYEEIRIEFRPLFPFPEYKSEQEWVHAAEELKKDIETDSIWSD